MSQYPHQIRQPLSNLDTTRAFSTAQALAAGITASSLRGPMYRKLRKGVYVSGATERSPFLDAQAALVGQPDTAFVSHFSAARILQLPVPTHPKEHVSAFDANDRRRALGIVCHVATPQAEVLKFRGVRISSPTQTFIELASEVTLVDLIVVGDAIVAKKWYTPEELIAACRQSEGKHAEAALRAACYVRKGVDSPMETRLRMLIVLAGLPEPEVNFKIRNDVGKVIRRLDLSYPALKLMVEYDGRQHAEDPAQYNSDVYRREEFDGLQWRTVIITSEGIYKNPEETLRRVHAALEERGATGLPTRLSDAWRPYFPGYLGIRRSS